jgi:hypothetical protein
MHEQYQHDQEKLLNAAAQSVGSAVIAGKAIVQLLTSLPKPIKVQVKTADFDVQSAQKNLQQGKTKPEILGAIANGETYKRIKRMGGDAAKYAQLMMRKAEINRAVLVNPVRKLARVKTPKKSL